ncbi:MAG: ferrous iron transport protein B [Firmicutes bacterium]|nr:ferrous iron transport protein B [Bacillota bacterium]
MNCCDISHQIDIPKGAKKIVLAGNPNVGKSIFFNYLTGIYVDVSNFPGTTLDISHGKFNKDVIIDTPGVYGVSSFNDEEIVARDTIAQADIVINIVDSTHLERDLFLTQQIIDMGIPVIVALNMMDESRERGLNIDVDKLSKELGVEIIPTVATKQKGLKNVKEKIYEAKKGNKSLKLNDKLKEIKDKTNNERDSLLILEGDENISKKHDIKPLNYREEVYKQRRIRIDEIIKNVINIKESESKFKSKLSRLMIKPITGIPLLLGFLYLIYKFIGVFVAQTVVGLTEETFFAEMYEPFIKGFVGNYLDITSLFGKLLVGEFGILTMTITYTFGLLLPLVVGFYLCLSILEDSGYLPRIATLVDRLLNKIGLNGRAIIPMLLGFGCVTMATITTRLLGSKREKIIAIFLLGLAIPCSAQIGVIAGLIAPLGAKYFIIYLATLFIVYVLAGTFLNKVLPGESSDLLIDLPPLRLPKIKNILMKTYIKSKSFVKEAGPIFLIGAIVITVMKEVGFLNYIQNLVAPITVNWLGLPKEASTAFIMGIVRRDFGAAGLNSLTMTPIQTTVSLITITLFVPCIAAMMIILKERNTKESLGIWFGSWIAAFLTGGIVFRLLS